MSNQSEHFKVTFIHIRISSEMSGILFWFLGFLGLLVGSLESSDPAAADLVTSLPGLSHTLPFRHYSGYLHSLNDSYLHYWFFESQHNPAKSPVVLWLNGGPGCSSLLGALTEIGPLQLDPITGAIRENQYGWTRNASILFLESPAGVGFS